MPLETISGIWALNPSYPYSSDDMSVGDDHLRGIKSAIRLSFPNISATAAVTASEINMLTGVVSNLADTQSSFAAGKAYATMTLRGSSAEFSASTSLSLFTGFDTPGVSSLATIKTASGAIAVTNAGHYGVDTNFCISASTAANITIAVYVNDTQSEIQGSGLVPAQGRGSIHASGIVSAEASDEVRVRILASVAKLITVKDAQLRVKRFN